MVTLKIKQKGFFITLSGITPFRTPADVDITHISIPLVVTHLRSLGIKKFEIVSDTSREKQSLNETPISKTKVGNGRLDKLEEMVKKLLAKNTSDTPVNREQITNKLEKLEMLSKEILEQSVYVPSKNKEPIVEEIDTFIPEIDIDNVILKGTSMKEVIKKDEDNTDETSDLLSRLIGGKSK